MTTSSQTIKELLTLVDALGIHQGMIAEQELLNYDWSIMRAKLVYSIPGMGSSKMKSATGLAMLQRAVQLNEQNLIIECQGSSIGGLDKSWLDDVGSCAHGKFPGVLSNTEIKLIFPTMAYAINSPQGVGAFGTIFFNADKWHRDTFPRRNFYQSESVNGQGQPLHAKTITAIGEDGVPQWWYIGSANFTPSAWGKYVKGRQSIMIANFELGVLLTTDDLKVICPQGFPWPYKRPIKVYGDKDMPWAQSICMRLGVQAEN